MEPERWERVKRIFNTVLERAPGDRDAYLDEACQGDPAIRQEIEILLASGAEMGTFLGERVPTKSAPSGSREHESFKNLVLDMAQERSVATLLRLIVSRLAERSHVALTRIWLVQPGDICPSCAMREECPDRTSCLHLVASAGSPAKHDQEDWSRLDGDFRRFPLGVRKVGYIGGEGHSVRVADISQDPHWIARPEWAQQEGIVGFGGQPLLFKGKPLGVLGVFTRTPFTEDAMIWLRMVADQAAVAIANAGAFEEIERLKKQLEWENTQLRDELGCLIGRGGMGEVWEGKHRMLARPAAIKLIPPGSLSLHSDESPSILLERFWREAQTTATLRSPHTVNVYDFGIGPDRTFYYVMELLEGLDLRSLIRDYGPQPPERMVYLLLQACHSLHEAHLSTFTHRDIKPSNLFLCHYGADFDFVKILDFGLVKTLNKGQGRSVDTQLTHQDSLSGTPAFMAPEMIVNEGEVDSRADLYGLGCVAYWLLTGRLVFEATSAMEMMIKHARDKPIPPSQCTEMVVSPAVDKVIMTCLEKAPSKRPDSAAELSEMLQSLRIAEDWTPEHARKWWELHLPGQNQVL